MSRKKFYRFCLLLFCLLGIASWRADAQETKNPPVNVDTQTLLRQIEEQRTQIEQLRQELKEETALREKQQALLDNLLTKLEKLDAALASTTATPAETRTQKTPTTDVNSTTNPSVAQSSPQETQTSPKKEENKPEKQADKPVIPVESGFGKIKFDGLIQGWFQAGDRGFNDSFRMRRAELKFTGDLLPKVKWTIMLDLAKALSVNNTTTTINNTPVIRDTSINQASRILQDAFITLGYFKRANIQVGQFKVPLSQEALQSSSALDTVDRALFLSDRSRGGGLGDTRDLGIMAFGPISDQFDYQFGIFNGVGESQNDVDRNDQKAFIGRIVFKPEFAKGLQIGTSGALGNGTGIQRRDRLGAELVYDRRPFRFKSEFMSGVDGDTHRRGFYAHAGYRFLPKFEGIFRFDMFDPDIRRETSSATVTERDYIAGLNYYIRENNFKLQINYLRKTFTGQITPSRNQLLINLQTSW